MNGFGLWISLSLFVVGLGIIWVSYRMGDWGWDAAGRGYLEVRGG